MAAISPLRPGRPRHAGQPAIFFGEARIEHTAEIDVAGRAAGGDDSGLAERGCEGCRCDDGDADDAPSRASRDESPSCDARTKSPRRLDRRASSGRINPAPARISSSSGSAGPPVGTIGPSSTEIAWCAAPETPISARSCWRRSMTLTAVRQQEFERRHAVVGKGADDLAVVVAVGGKPLVSTPTSQSDPGRTSFGESSTPYFFW